MSNSLVRTSLELFGYDESSSKDKKKKRRSQVEGALELIPFKHRIGTKKNRKSKKNPQGRGKLTVHAAKKQLELQSDPTEENVERLLLLSGRGIDGETTEKLFRRVLKKSGVVEEETPKPPETTAFTEEDFKKFEEEYFEL